MWIEPQQCKEYLWRRHGSVPAVGLRVQPDRLLRSHVSDFDDTTDDPQIMDRWIAPRRPCVIVDDAVTSCCIMGLDSDGDYIIGDPHGPTVAALRSNSGQAAAMLMALV